MRIAIVGCGKVADDHADAIQRRPGAELVACCDREELMAEQLATRFDIPTFTTDLETLLAEGDIDVVHITTPPQSHLSIGEAALEAGCHLWVEKPFAVDAEETQRLLDTAGRHGRKITVGHSYWLDTPAEDIRSIVEAGQIGDVVHVESWYGYDLSGAYGGAIMDSPDNWVHDLPGKLFQNNADHLLNKVLEFLPSNDLEVHASAFRRLERRDGDRRDDLLDELRVTLRDPAGPTAYATFTSSVKPTGQWFRLYGTKGTVEADFGLRTVELVDSISIPTNLGRLLPSFARVGTVGRTAARNAARFARSEFHYFQGFRRLLDDFYRTIETDGEPPIPYDEILRMARVQDEIWEQIGQ